MGRIRRQLTKTGDGGGGGGAKRLRMGGRTELLRRVQVPRLFLLALDALLPALHTARTRPRVRAREMGCEVAVEQGGGETYGGGSAFDATFAGRGQPPTHLSGSSGRLRASKGEHRAHEGSAASPDGKGRGRARLRTSAGLALLLDGRLASLRGGGCRRVAVRRPSCSFRRHPGGGRTLSRGRRECSVLEEVFGARRSVAGSKLGREIVRSRRGRRAAGE